MKFEYFTDAVNFMAVKGKKAHIINYKTDKSYCGFDGFYANIFENDGKVVNADICSKCLNAYNLAKEKNQVGEVS